MASGDKIYVARQDTLEEVNGKTDTLQISIGNHTDLSTDETVFGGIKSVKEIVSSINSTYGTDDFLPLDKIIYKAGASFVRGEFTQSGTVNIPYGSTGILITACGGGGGGGGAYSQSKYGGGGGGGGAAVSNKLYEIAPDKWGSELAITIGKGGAGGTSADDGVAGSATVIGDIVTLAGGSGGVRGFIDGRSNGGSAGGTGGGKGGNYGKSGNAGIVGSGGNSPATSSSSYPNVCGGGGGGALGNGGDGGKGYTSNATNSKGKDGTKGGGGGGAATTSSGTEYAGGKGGDGYAYIEFVW